jgi:Ca2+-binding RTX toxin-like protein
MPMFDYKGEDGRELIAVALQLSQFYNNDEVTLEDGWRKLTAEELGVDPANVDLQGQFRGVGLVDAQALILGRFVDGQLVRVSVAFTATNGADAVDYEAMADDSYVNAFDYLLDAVRVYSAGAGLTGEDVIVTGYSLGAGVTNNMAAQRETSWAGFYADSDYLAFAVPKITEAPDVFNFGFENDVVHRVTGEGDKDPRAADPLLGVTHYDREFKTATDNIVLFNDTYANPLFPAAPFVLANFPEGWSAHLDGAQFDVVGLIGGSHFYDYIEQDSTVVVAYLTEALRTTVWVEDKATSTSSHFGTMGFILGGATADRLGDGSAGDFLDGFAGDDRFRLSSGNDHVHGGEGLDTVQLAGAIADYDAFRLSDGTLFLYDRTGVNGLETLQSVEAVTTAGLLDPVYSVGRRGLDGDGVGPADIAYKRVQEGSLGEDALRGGARVDRLFALDGDDRLFGGRGADLLHGGEGRDVLRGGAGDDFLFGGAGDDRILAGAGGDTLAGGVGSDVFQLGRLSGDDVILDFNEGEQGRDRIRLDRSEFGDFAAIVDASRQVGDDLIIEGADGSLTLVGLSLADLSSADFVLV